MRHFDVVDFDALVMNEVCTQTPIASRSFRVVYQSYFQFFSTYSQSVRAKKKKERHTSSTAEVPPQRHAAGHAGHAGGALRRRAGRPAGMQAGGSAAHIHIPARARLRLSVECSSFKRALMRLRVFVASLTSLSACAAAASLCARRCRGCRL